MPTVSVDLEDLERLVMTSGALKTIEGALAQRKADPFIRDHLEFTEAHNRLASAMRNAKRGDADTLVPWDGDLDEDEIKFLRKIESTMFTSKAPLILTRDEKAPGKGESMSIADRLAAKGCVIMGQLVKGVLWAGDTKPMLVPDPSGYPVKITDRGIEKLAKLNLPKEAT